MKKIISILFIMFLIQNTSFSEAKSQNKDTTENSITVYVDVTIGNRKGGAVKKLNKSHKKYDAKGYRLVDIETFTENGDLEGFFVSYVKTSLEKKNSEPN